MSEENEATQETQATEAPNVADEFSELCDAMRDKYGMPEGDWKALLDKGMALYARIPEGALSFEGVQVVTNESALTAVDVIRRDLDPILGRLEEGLRNGVAKEENAESKKPEREIGADEGAAWAAELMRNLVQHRIDTMLEDIGVRGNPRPATQLLAEAATARLAERAAALLEAPRPHPVLQGDRILHGIDMDTEFPSDLGDADEDTQDEEERAATLAGIERMLAIDVDAEFPSVSTWDGAVE